MAHLRAKCRKITDLGVTDPDIEDTENMFHRVGLRVGSRISKGEFERKHILGNRAFAHVIVIISLWYIGAYLIVGFMGTFKTTELALSLGVIQVINVAASLCRILVFGLFGRYSDRTSYAKGYRTALLCMAVAFAINIFTVPERKWLVFLSAVLYQVGSAGIGQNGENMCHNYVDREYIVSAMAIKNCISGLLGFGASLIGSRILMAAFFYAKYVVEKQERVIQ